MDSSVLEGKCPLCDHELRRVGRVNIHKNIQPLFDGIDKAEVFNCDSCTFTYAVIRDVARPEVEPTVLCGHRDEISFTDGIKWVSDQDLQGRPQTGLDRATRLCALTGKERRAGGSATRN